MILNSENPNRFDTKYVKNYTWYVLNTSAVSSTSLESMLIFANCAINRPLVFTDALSFDCIYMAPTGVVRVYINNICYQEYLCLYVEGDIETLILPYPAYMISSYSPRVYRYFMFVSSTSRFTYTKTLQVVGDTPSRRSAAPGRQHEHHTGVVNKI